MKSILKKIIPNSILKVFRQTKLDLLDGYAQKSYSQEGEDMILRRIFEKQEKGFYVDVGAHHPKRFSNTYFFYKKGWHGINIDAMPGSMTPFKKIRNRDVNLEAAIAKESKEMTFFIYNHPALNTFDEELVLQRSNKTEYIRKEKIITTTIEDILTEYLPERSTIDFISIDVEGLDLEVLESNNWELFRPQYILVESEPENFNKIVKKPIYNFLTEKQYELFAKTCRTLIFKNSRD